MCTWKFSARRIARPTSYQGKFFHSSEKKANIIVVSGCLGTYSGISDPLELKQVDLAYGDPSEKDFIQRMAKS